MHVKVFNDKYISGCDYWENLIMVDEIASKTAKKDKGSYLQRKKQHDTEWSKFSWKRK